MASKHGKQTDREIMKKDMSDMSSCQMKSKFHSCKQGLISTSLCVVISNSNLIKYPVVDTIERGIHLLVGGFKHVFFHHGNVINVIIPTDELIFFRGVGQAPTRN